MYFVFKKRHMFVRLNLVANLMGLIYVYNTLPLAPVRSTKLPDIFGPLMVGRKQHILFASFARFRYCFL